MDKKSTKNKATVSSVIDKSVKSLLVDLKKNNYTFIHHQARLKSIDMLFIKQ